MRVLRGVAVDFLFPMFIGLSVPAFPQHRANQSQSSARPSERKKISPPQASDRYHRAEEFSAAHQRPACTMTRYLHSIRVRWTALILAWALGATLGSPGCLGQSATTEPVGYMTFELPGTPTGGSVDYPFTVPMTLRPVYVSRIDTVSGNSFTVAVAQPDIVPFTGTGGSYFVLIQTGAARAAVLPMVSATGNQITVRGPIPPGALEPGVSFSVRRYFTLNDLRQVGNGNVYGGGLTIVSGWVEATGPDQGDELVTWDPETQASAVYYLQPQASGPSQWRTAGSTLDQGETALPWPGGWVITRRGPEPLRLIAVGHVPVADTRLQYYWPGLNILGLPFGNGVTLNASRIYDSSSPWTVQGGLSALEADTLTIYRQRTDLVDDLVLVREPTVFFSLDDEYPGWREVGTLTDRSNLTLPLNGSLMLQHSGSGGWVRNFTPGLDLSPTPRSQKALPVRTWPLSVSNQSGRLNLTWTAPRKSLCELQTSTDNQTWVRAGQYAGRGGAMTIKRTASRETEFFRVIQR
jgi:hypothetical protein